MERTQIVFAHQPGDAMLTAGLAGFTQIETYPTTFHLHHGSPPGYFHGMLQEFAEILDSARDSLQERLRARADEARAQVVGIESDPGGSFTYTCFRARASR